MYKYFFSTLLLCNSLFSEPCIDVCPLSYAEYSQHPRYAIATQHPFNPKDTLYFLELRNFPANTEVQLSMHRFFFKEPNEFYKVSRATIVDDQKWISEHKQILAPFHIIEPKGFMPGEQITFRVECLYSGLTKDVKITPLPILSKSQSGAFSIKATLKEYNPTFYAIELTGVKPDEELTFRSTSGKEKLENIFKYSSEILYSPDVAGKKGGVASVEFLKKNGEKVLIKLPWGTELAKYLKGEKTSL